MDLSEVPHVEREMALVRVKAEDRSRAEVLRIADIFRCRVVDVSPSTYTLEITGNHEKNEAVLGLLKNARHPGSRAQRHPGHPAEQEGIACRAGIARQIRSGAPRASPEGKLSFSR